MLLLDLGGTPMLKEIKNKNMNENILSNFKRKLLLILPLLMIILITPVGTLDKEKVLVYNIFFNAFTDALNGKDVIPFFIFFGNYFLFATTAILFIYYHLEKKSYKSRTISHMTLLGLLISLFTISLIQLFKDRFPTNFNINIFPFILLSLYYILINLLKDTKVKVTKRDLKKIIYTFLGFLAVVFFAKGCEQIPIYGKIQNIENSLFKGILLQIMNYVNPFILFFLITLILFFYYKEDWYDL
jgi:hypothetical protein